MKILLALILLLIQPVSNEQIQQNMGFQQPQIVQYQQQPQYFQHTGPAKAPWRDDYYTVIAANGKVFTIVYRTIIGDYGIIVRDDDGLGLSGWYGSIYDMQQAVQKAIEQYNQNVPVGSPICLLLFVNLYLTYVWYKQRRLGKVDSRRLD